MAARPESLASVIERGFADGVAERIARGPFTFTDRAALLAAGQRLGIDRVRGNAIIADQQQKARAPARSPGVMTTVGTFVAVQSSITAAIAWALRG